MNIQNSVKQKFESMKYFKNIFDKSALALCHNGRCLLYALIILLFFSFNQNVYSQWRKIDLPAGYANNIYLDIFFLDDNPNYGWACGYNGAVLRTVDGGLTWEGTIVSNFVNQLESIMFVDENLGYVADATSSTVFRSLDGGATWQLVLSPLDGDIWGLYALGDRVFATGGGCAFGSQFFYRSDDRGVSWSEARYNEENTKTSDLIVYPDGTGVAVSSGHLWQTRDFGANWEIFANTGGQDWHEEITHLDDSFLVPVSAGCTGTTDNQGGARFTTDNGATWNTADFGVACFGSFLTGPEEGWVVGFGETIYHTTDAGLTWELKNCGIEDGDNLDDLWFINDTTAFAAGNGIYKMSAIEIVQPEIASEPLINLCPGETVELSAQRNYEFYEWSTGETTKSITVSEEGDYWLTAWNNPCDSSTTDIVSVRYADEAPIDIVISDNLPCEGDVVTLTVQQDYENYEWSTGETSRSILITESGTYTVTYVDPESSCSFSESVSVDFIEVPEIDAFALGDITICVGQEVNLEASLGFDRYEWYRDDANNLFSNQRIITVTESGNYFVKGILGEDCEDMSDAIEVVVSNIEDVLSFRFDTEDIFDFGEVRYPRLLCLPLEITNNGDVDFELTNPYMFRNIAFSAPSSQFPVTIPANSSSTFDVCYTPTMLNIQRDTVSLEDNCSDKLIPLVAEGLGGVNNMDTKCETELELETIAINSRYEFSANPPDPNPSYGKMSVSFVKSYKDNEFSKNEKAFLYDMLGNKLMEGIYLQNSSRLLDENTQFIDGEFLFNASSLSSGSYILIIETLDNTYSYPVTIIK